MLDWKRLIERHGIVGPVLCGTIIIGSVYGGVMSMMQIRKEWGYLVKNSRQDWKKKIAPISDPNS